MSEELKTGVLDAYLFLRKNNHDISDNVLEFINNSADKIERLEHGADVLYGNIKQLEQENLELKAYIDDFKGVCRVVFEESDGDCGDMIPQILIDVYDKLPKQSLAERDKQVRKEFVSFVKKDSNLTGVEKLIIHTLLVKFERLNKETK